MATPGTQAKAHKDPTTPVIAATPTAEAVDDNHNIFNFLREPYHYIVWRSMNTFDGPSSSGTTRSRTITHFPALKIKHVTLPTGYDDFVAFVYQIHCRFQTIGY